MKVEGKLIQLEGDPHIYLQQGRYKRHVMNPTILAFICDDTKKAEIAKVDQETFDKFKTALPLDEKRAKKLVG